MTVASNAMAVAAPHCVRSSASKPKVTGALCDDDLGGRDVIRWAASDDDRKTESWNRFERWSENLSRISSINLATD